MNPLLTLRKKVGGSLQSHRLLNRLATAFAAIDSNTFSSGWELAVYYFSLKLSDL